MADNMDYRVDFSDILHRSRELRDLQEASTRAFPDSIPRLERALPQIDKESRRLVAENVNAVGRPNINTASADEQALRFLSERGIPTGNLADTLQAGAILEDAFTTYAEPPDTDVGGFLERQQEDFVIDAMETSLSLVTEISRRHIATRSDADWDTKKRERISTQAMRSTPGRRTPRSKKDLSGVFASPFRFSREAQSPSSGSKAMPVFEAVVRRAISARSNPITDVPIATYFDDEFCGALAPRGNTRNAPRNVQNLHFTFTALRYIVGEVGESLPREGEYSGLVLPADRRNVILRAIKFLSLQFREEKMRHEISMNPQQAARGGIPGIQGDVRAYLNILYTRGIPEELAVGPMLHGLPLWSQVYFCLRSGDFNAAHEVIMHSMNTGVHDKSVALYEECLRAFIESGKERRIPDELLVRLVQDYGMYVRRGTDPFQRVCYVVIARLDPNAGDKMALEDEDYRIMFQSIENFLWLRLSIARIDNDSSLPSSLSSYALSLKSVQEEMRQYGPSHFDPRGDSPVFYAYVLLLSGQFKQAIEYLDKVSDSSAEAVHIAFVLYYYDMLRAENQGGDYDERNHVNDLLGSDCLTVNYAEVLWRYVTRFASNQPSTAVVYLFTIRDPATRNRYLTKLLLETKDIKTLVGAIDLSESDTVLVGRKSIYEEMWPLAGTAGNDGGSFGWLNVAENAANIAEDKGAVSVAIPLYYVCGRYGKVAGLLIEKLSAELTSRNAPVRESTHKDAIAFQGKMKAARNGTGRIENIGVHDNLLEIAMPTLDTLLKLYSFYDLFWAGRYADAWYALKSTGVLPRKEQELVIKTQELRPGNNHWDDKLCERIPDLVLTGMRCIVKLYEVERDDPQTRENVIRELREESTLLINFAAMMPNSSADLSAKLLRNEVQMT